MAARDRADTGVADGGIHEAASTEASRWNEGKLDAMEGRMLAESIRINGYVPLWNAGQARRHGRAHAGREHPDRRVAFRSVKGGALTADVVGREPELAILDRFLDSIPAGPAALLLSGEAGIGKTTVWREGLDGARRRRYRTLSCGPVEAETRLSYAALGDLLEPVLEDALPTLPEPQRRALEVALLLVPELRRRGPTSGPSPWPSSDAFGR